MKEINKEELLDRYNAGTASEAEKALVESWYMQAQFPANLPDADQVLVDQSKSRNQLIQHMQARKTFKLWPRIAVAAAAVAVIVSSVYFYNRQASLKAIQQTAVVNDIAPGKNGATITLANGNVIELSDAKTGVVVGSELKYNDGAAVQGGSPDQYRSSTAGADDVMQLTASTAKGQTYQFTLPDGTKVWLNADSKISFPSQFSGKQRKILLEGEGYFEVSKNKAKPFIVQTDKQEVTVLGTHFNINAYSDDTGIKTTLLEGSVRVRHLEGSASTRTEPFASSMRPKNNMNAELNLLNSTDKRSLPAVRDDGNALTLKPNQQSLVTANQPITVKEIDPSEVVDWKNEEFVFNEQSITDIMRKIGRWYNIDVVYQPGIDTRQTFSGKVSRTKKISEVLKIMQSTGQVKFRIEGRKVYVIK